MQMDLLEKLRPALNPAHVANLDGGREMAARVNKLANLLPICGCNAPSDGVDLAIAAVLNGSQSIDEMREHVHYVLDQLGRFAINLDKEAV